MFSVFRILLVGGVLMGGLGFIMYHVMKFAMGINNPASLAKKDGAKLRAALGPYIDRLVPFTDGEMELLSLNHESTTKRKGMFTLKTGVYNSVYHEPLLAYAYKNYRNKSVSTLLARTLEDEFFYVSHHGETQVYHNGKALGIIIPSGKLLSPDRKKLLAEISPEDILELHPIKINNKEVGKVLNPQSTEKISPRAFQFLQKMDEDEKALFLSLSILSIVEESSIA